MLQKTLGGRINEAWQICRQQLPRSAGFRSVLLTRHAYCHPSLLLNLRADRAGRIPSSRFASCQEMLEGGGRRQVAIVDGIAGAE